MQIVLAFMAYSLKTKVLKTLDDGEKWIGLKKRRLREEEDSKVDWNAFFVL